ncbi:hypothetical protein EJ05DRAFT_137895 [Pseudovirgaria hyperparasitica]|uniref:Uncharacterized protein n=1 Tax=Pseudovirgaria hyperparasitica TaxID=470096 RepID=A0A6A6VYK7_9PEZI|nr:uncharacterized protein EJ05DRAFT_137895 [Pseudovirgaria hyperparasitica]KAF2754916.1 hypothetical protein EJ05DRAFT_137895 [Pseudovirgaria hyperparasitica]
MGIVPISSTPTAPPQCLQAVETGVNTPTRPATAVDACERLKGVPPPHNGIVKCEVLQTAQSEPAAETRHFFRTRLFLRSEIGRQSWALSVYCPRPRPGSNEGGIPLSWPAWALLRPTIASYAKMISVACSYDCIYTASPSALRLRPLVQQSLASASLVQPA